METKPTKQNTDASLRLLLESFAYFDDSTDSRLTLIKRLETMATYLKNGGSMPNSLALSLLR